MKATQRILALGLALVLTASMATAQFMSPIQYWRSYDKSGLNVFETPKDSGAAFNGLGVRIGGGFTQGYQILSHENYLGEPGTSPDDDNDLYNIGNGFNNASANLNIDAQFAPGVRMNLVLYLSSRHHTETWVKGGFIQFDELGFLNSAFLDDIMDVLTIRVGHMEVNYGDAHFRRTDNGSAIYNPFIENYLIDAFTTEIGADFTVQTNGFLGVLGLTNGEIKGNVTGADPEAKDITPAIYAKLGYDGQVSEDMRVRVTGSMYTQGKSPRNTLFRGDRAGSHYWGVMEESGASLGSKAWSGRLNPNFSDHLTAFMFNALLDVGIGSAGNIEFFGTYEMGSGNNSEETDANKDRTFNQIAADLIYRIGQSQDVYVAFRYNMVNMENGFVDSNGDYTTQAVDRMAFAAGWFVLDYVLLKGEFVMQNYNDYPADNILTDGKFSGVVFEAVVGF